MSDFYKLFPKNEQSELEEGILKAEHGLYFNLHETRVCLLGVDNSSYITSIGNQDKLEKGLLKTYKGYYVDIDSIDSVADGSIGNLLSITFRSGIAFLNRKFKKKTVNHVTYTENSQDTSHP